MLPEGLSDAKFTGHALKDTPFSLFLTSDLIRAVQTANIIHNENIYNHLSPLEESILLREMNFGLREGHGKSVTTEDARILYATKNNIPTSDVRDWAETENDLHLRQSELIEYIHSKLTNTNHISNNNNNDNNNNDNSENINGNTDSNNNSIHHNILLVSHGAYIRRFLTNFCSIKGIHSILNCSITKVDVYYNKQNNKFTYHINDIAKDLNSVAHLPITEKESEL